MSAMGKGSGPGPGQAGNQNWARGRQGAGAGPGLGQVGQGWAPAAATPWCIRASLGCTSAEPNPLVGDMLWALMITGKSCLCKPFLTSSRVSLKRVNSSCGEKRTVLVAAARGLAGRGANEGVKQYCRSAPEG